MGAQASVRTNGTDDETAMAIQNRNMGLCGLLLDMYGINQWSLHSFLVLIGSVNQYSLHALDCIICEHHSMADDS
jgi:hypothetical protein